MNYDRRGQKCSILSETASVATPTALQGSKLWDKGHLRISSAAHWTRWRKTVCRRELVLEGSRSPSGVREQVVNPPQITLGRQGCVSSHAAFGPRPHGAAPPFAWLSCPSSIWLFASGTSAWRAIANVTVVFSCRTNAASTDMKARSISPASALSCSPPTQVSWLHPV